jgi:hypothetical protein
MLGIPANFSPRFLSFRMGNASGPRLENVRSQGVISRKKKSSRTDRMSKCFIGAAASRLSMATIPNAPASGGAFQPTRCFPDTIRAVRDQRDPLTRLTH